MMKSNRIDFLNILNSSSSMVHEYLARLFFFEEQINFNNKRVLDVGCGKSFNCFYLAKKIELEEAIAIDIHLPSIVHCEENYSLDNVKYLIQNCYEFNEGLGLFDIVLFTEMIEHVEDQKLLIQNIVRYLKPGGGCNNKHTE
jgi:2-polyprenyl-6-hydroxyphenyl methylase / 3-demethylubiquinone-9 3-methyltransferase